MLGLGAQVTKRGYILLTPDGRTDKNGDQFWNATDTCCDIDKSGVDYRLNPMGTVLEGEWDEVFGVVKKCYERMRKDCGRISCTIKVDYRKAAKGRLSGKVASVEKRLKRAIKQ